MPEDDETRDTRPECWQFDGWLFFDGHEIDMSSKEHDGFELGEKLREGLMVLSGKHVRIRIEEVEPEVVVDGG